MAATDTQVRKLMGELQHGTGIGVAALRVGLDRKTARKYRDLGKLPSEEKQARTWRTREDPFVEDWPAIEAMLVDVPELEAKTLFEWLCSKRPGRYDPGQLRTLQRRVRRWQAQFGPDKRVFFSQEHRPGERAQTDFTSGHLLGITILGEVFRHLLCHVVLPFSNWQWVTVCRSESMAALHRGVQAAFFTLGFVPRLHQTDNSTAATHNLRTGKREFNDDYLALIEHLSMKPVTTGIGEKEQNGDVEAANGVLKRRIEQHLLLRGSRDFDSVVDYERWLREIVVAPANANRSTRLREEISAMTPLHAAWLPEFKELDVQVTTWSTIRVKFNAYSVPSRLIGERLRVRIYDDRLEVWYAGCHELTMERLHGRGGHRIDYRDVIHSLVRRPGAFARYRYREDLFPRLVFRRAYDALCSDRCERQADLAYLKILQLAADHLESEVAVALEAFLAEGVVADCDAVTSVVAPRQPEIPDMAAFDVDLAEYDALLEEVQR